MREALQTRIAGEEWVRVEGHRVRFQRSGAGPALVLVHGLLGYLFSWRFAAPLLANDREVFALDMPGSGLSDCSAQLDCRLKAAAQRLLGFMDAMGISSCDLLGSSYGGTTAMMAAALVPERFRTLTLVSPANPWSKIGRMRIKALDLPFLANVFPTTARLLTPLNAFSISRMFGDSRRMPADTIPGYGAVLSRPGVVEHAVKIVRCFQTDMKRFPAVLPKAAHIPTLLIWGNRDRVVDPASAEAVRRQFQNAQVAVIQGAGHLPYEEYPEEFSRIVLDFLSRNSSAGSGREVT